LLHQFHIEPVDEGTEQTLKLRLSTTLGEVKLPVYSNDTIAIAKKKLQVCIILITYFIEYIYIYIYIYMRIIIYNNNNNDYNAYRVKKVWNLHVKGGSLVVNCLVIKCT